MEEKIENLFKSTTLTYVEIAIELGITYAIVQYYIAKHFSKEDINKRKHKTYRKSRLGNKNPMFGKKEDRHPNYKGDVSDCKGYLLCLKPDWYTGRKRSNHIFKHHKVMCEYLGITEIQKGYCVHHKDGNKLNNDISNLEYMTISEHSREHLNFNLNRKGGSN